MRSEIVEQWQVGLSGPLVPRTSEVATQPLPWCLQPSSLTPEQWSRLEDLLGRWSTLCAELEEELEIESRPRSLRAAFSVGYEINRAIVAERFAASRDQSVPAFETFDDPLLAEADIGLHYTRDGALTNCVELLVRPTDIRRDDAGRHGEERFALVKMTRAELRSMLEVLERDWAEHVAARSGVNLSER